MRGGPPGDLYIVVHIDEHPVFHRDADDIHMTLPIMPWEAALGAKIEVPTIDGRARLRIPPGTQSGQKLRMSEKGVTFGNPPGRASATRSSRSASSCPEIPNVRPKSCGRSWKSCIRKTRGRSCGARCSSRAEREPWVGRVRRSEGLYDQA